MKIKIGFFAVLLLLILAITSFEYFPALILSVAIHESGHIFMAKMRKIDLSELKLGIFGACISPTNSLFSYTDEILLCLGGPLFNFLSVLVHVYILKLSPSSLFLLYSFSLGMLNMLPISGFDGGRIFMAILCRFFSSITASKISKFISFVFIFSLWSFSIYLLLKLSASLSAFVFSISMFVKIFIPDVL